MNLSVHDSMAQHYAAVRSRLMGRGKVVQKSIATIERLLPAPVAIEKVKEIEVENQSARSRINLETPQEIIERICDKYDIEVDEMLSGPNTRKVYRARCKAIYEVAAKVRVDAKPLLYKEIAEIFNMHQSTIAQIMSKRKSTVDYSDTPEPWHEIIEQVCSERGLDKKALMSRSRKYDVVEARHEVFYRLRTEVIYQGKVMSFPFIASFFGLDHTTIMSGIKKHQQRLNCDKSPH